MALPNGGDPTPPVDALYEGFVRLVKLEKSYREG